MDQPRSRAENGGRRTAEPQRNGRGITCYLEDHGGSEPRGRRLEDRSRSPRSDMEFRQGRNWSPRGTRSGGAASNLMKRRPTATQNDRYARHEEERRRREEELLRLERE